MLFIGLLTWIGLSIIGVPLALTLGLIAGLLSFVPNFGPILSAVPAILLAFVEGFHQTFPAGAAQACPRDFIRNRRNAFVVAHR